ncbi:MAG: hypothetical protein RLZZ519_2150 [Bacteroidota bacterium]|jgi:hypothetical protein
MLLLGVGCRYGLPEAEIQDMMGLQQGWEQIVSTSESKFQSINEKHGAFMAALQDTSNWQRRTLIQQDTMLKLQISRLSTNFDGAKRRHIYNLKEMRTFLDASKVWLQRIGSEETARQLARRSWQARTTTFETLFKRMQTSEAAFDAIAPQYTYITKLLPSIAPMAPVIP